MIPIRTNKIFKNRILNLNDPSKELNVNKIHRVNNFFSQKKKKKNPTRIGHIKIINIYIYIYIDIYTYIIN